MEYKFKAWDKTQNKMITDFLMENIKGFNWNRMAISFNGQIFAFTDWDLADYKEEEMLNTSCYVDRFVILPSTGVKDINKKESYLGDIVKLENSIGVITFEDGCYEIDWVINEDFFTERLGAFKEVFEIIGNRFENEDMIKKEVQRVKHSTGYKTITGEEIKLGDKIRGLQSHEVIVLWDTKEKNFFVELED